MPPFHDVRDVLIVGAGPAGLALAAALADTGATVTVLEQQPLAAIESPAEDGREIALTHRARGVMVSLGLWRHLPDDEIAPLRAASVADGDRPAGLHFDTGGDGPLGWLVSNHRIREAALAAARERPGVVIEGDARVTGLATDDRGARVTLSDGRVLRGAVVVAADSRFSGTRRLAGIGAAMRDFGRSVVVGRVAVGVDHGGVARECFRHGHTLALLPMTGQRCSAVVTVPADQAPAWLALDDGPFAARIEAAAGGTVGCVTAAGPRHHYPLVGVYAHRFAARRFALVGDAAVGMHPVTAHGWNFGLYGVQVLARELRRHGLRDATSIDRALQAYAAEHRRTTLPIYLGTNAVVRLFTDDRPLARLARPAVLAFASRAPAVGGLIRSAITRQLTGGVPA